MWSANEGRATNKVRNPGAEMWGERIEPSQPPPTYAERTGSLCCLVLLGCGSKAAEAEAELSWENKSWADLRQQGKQLACI